jgi:hypothetical protein
MTKQKDPQQQCNQDHSPLAVPLIDGRIRKNSTNNNSIIPDESNKKRRTGSSPSFSNVSNGEVGLSDNHKCHHPTKLMISQSDHDRIVSLLQAIDWDKAKNTSRRNVIRYDDPLTPRLRIGNKKKEQPYCQSFIFGRNMKDPNCSLSWWSTQYPLIYQELRNLMQQYNSRFSYTHITLNKNLQCKRHTDGGNAGLSYIIGLGTYTGGQLQIESPTTISGRQHSPNPDVDDDTMVTKKKSRATPASTTTIHDLYRTFVLFNGKIQPHETLSFTGERYTLVYYTSDIVPKEYSVENGSNSSLGSDRKHGSSVHPTNDVTTNTNIPISAVSTALADKFNAIKSKLGRKRS